MPGEVWIPEAEDLTPVGGSNPMSGVGGPRATLHCTVSRPGSFDDMVRVLRNKRAESNLVYDGKTDRLGQFYALDRAGRSLMRGSLPYSHNRVGTVNIQIEVCNMPVDWTASSDWNPGPNFRAMIRAVRSWGIRDEFVGRLARTGSDRANVAQPLSLLTSEKGGGVWWGHCHYPDGETHWDPGPLNLDRFFGAAPAAPTVPEEDEVTPEDHKAIAYEVWRYQYRDRQALSYLVTADANSRAGRRASEDAETRADANAAALEAYVKAQDDGITPGEIAGIVDKAVRDRLAKLAVVDREPVEVPE